MRVGFHFAQQAVDDLDIQHIGLAEIVIAHSRDDFLGVVDLEHRFGIDEAPNLDEKLVVTGREPAGMEQRRI